VSIQPKIEEDLKKALRERAEITRDTLRMLLADLKKKQIDENRDLTEDEELAVFQKAVKMRQESIVQSRRAGATISSRASARSSRSSRAICRSRSPRKSFARRRAESSTS
jgi:hypothetical protein